MADLQKAAEKQLANLEIRSGKSLDELVAMLESSGLSKHGELRSFLKQELSMGHGDANAMVHYFRNRGTALATPEKGSGDPLDEIYVGPKEALRPIHEALVRAMDQFGDYEAAPKKGYISYRRKKQLATVRPATKTRVDVGLNVKGLPATARLIELPPGGMCNYKIQLTRVDEVDEELLSWLRRAFDSAG